MDLTGLRSSHGSTNSTAMAAPMASTPGRAEPAMDGTPRRVAQNGVKYHTGAKGSGGVRWLEIAKFGLTGLRPSHGSTNSTAMAAPMASTPGRAEPAMDGTARRIA